MGRESGKESCPRAMRSATRLVLCCRPPGFEMSVEIQKPNTSYMCDSPYCMCMQRKGGLMQAKSKSRRGADLRNLQNALSGWLSVYSSFFDPLISRPPGTLFRAAAVRVSFLDNAIYVQS